MARKPSPIKTSSPQEEVARHAQTGTRNLGKVTPPRAHGVYPAMRLFHRLDEDVIKPVLWIHAPPGAGKTTLATSYLSNKGITPLWYRLDEGDADAATVFFYLSAAWKGSGTGESLPVLTPDKRPGLTMFARQFFRAMFACPLTSVLVFDDYHEVATDSPLHACVASGIEEVPEGCRVIIVSRVPPPPAFAKLRMNGQLAVVEPDMLRLTADEAKGLARQRGAAVSDADVELIVTRTQGWTAGLILMLDAGEQALAEAAPTTATSEVLFDYFAGEIFDRMAADHQRLLCILALMPTMTAAAAVDLAGTAEAQSLLEELRRRNYFTVRDVAAVPRYRFHPLFREFLLAQGSARLPAAELNRLQIAAGAVLDAAGQPEDAAGLLEEAGAFEALADLIVRHAANLFDEGRFATLGAWLAKLPAEMVEARPWLYYWASTAPVYSNPAESFAKLARAFELFCAAGDVTGQFTAWASQAEAVRVDAFGDNRRFDALYDVMHDLLRRHPEIPPGRVMLRVALGMAMGISRRSNKRDEMAMWQARTRAAARDAPGDFLAGQVDYWFLISDLHDANFAQARHALETLPDPLCHDRRHIVVDVSGHIAFAAGLVYRQKAGDCGALCEETIRRMDAGGSFIWSHQVAALGANAAYRRGDLDACAYWLRRSAECSDRVAPVRGTHYHYAAAQYHLGIRDFETAIAHADTGIELAITTGWYFFEVLSRLTRAETFLEIGDLAAAEAELLVVDEIHDRSTTRGTMFGAELLKADLALLRGDASAGLAWLAEALARGRRQGDRSIAILSRRAGKLLAMALEAKIEPDYVRAFIKSSGIPAPDQADAWPWPLKIRTLGGFAVTRYDEPLSFGRKTPKRLIMLLKAIVAYGARDVPEEKLVDAIWPDEDGDAAHSSLTIAIHRLRKLLGDASLVVVKAGKVGLDPTRCWLDSWEFELRLAPRKAEEIQAAFEARRRDGLALYRGDFLPDETDIWWTAGCRETLRKRRQRALAAT